MALRLEDRWVWDFWLAVDGPDYHMFYLQAPMSLGDQRLRHVNATVGHAISQDLRTWEVLPDALSPSPTGGWDDMAIWTGSIVQHGARWHMLYTACSRKDDGLVQRIGRAVSDDLITWERVGSAPAIEADPEWYELLDTNVWHDQAWRDPWVFADPDGRGFHALITARVNHGAADGRGVIAHATSPDLVDWAVHPPITEPGEFGQLEVPQVAMVDDAPVLLFSSDVAHLSHVRGERVGDEARTGTYAVPGGRLLGPFDIESNAVAVGGPHLYSGRVVQGPKGDWVLLGFVNFVDGEFVGEIADPIPFTAPILRASPAT